MKHTLYAAAIGILLTSGSRAMHEAAFPTLQAAYPQRYNDQEISSTVVLNMPTIWDTQDISLAEHIKTSDEYVMVETPEHKDSYKPSQPKKSLPPVVHTAVTASPSAAEILDEDDQTPYALKADRRHQKYLNRCYHGSRAKSEQYAAYVAHILYKKTDINPPRKKEADAPKPSEPTRQLVHNVQPQETIKKDYIHGNNTPHIMTPSKPVMPVSFIPPCMLNAIIAVSIGGIFR
jgi:hypothetical protein